MDAQSKATLKIIAKEKHKPVIRKFKRRKVITLAPNETWAGDLVDMNDQAELNKGYRYMLNVIDIYSRFAWIAPMKKKDADSTVEAFQKIVKEAKTTPTNFWVDEGKEFYNSKLKAYLEKHDINMYSTFGTHKSAMIERFNRTIKEKMFRRFTEDNDDEWVNKIKSVLKDYNNTIHSSTDKKPVDMIKEKIPKPDTEETTPKTTKHKFAVGDRVRTTLPKKVFDKGYKGGWTDEIYIVKEIANTNPPTYVIEDLQGERIKGKMYEQELQKSQLKGDITKEAFLMEKILKTRTVKGKKEFFVKWVGYPAKFNRWIPESNILK